MVQAPRPASVTNKTHKVNRIICSINWTIRWIRVSSTLTGSRRTMRSFMIQESSRPSEVSRDKTRPSGATSMNQDSTCTDRIQEAVDRLSTNNNNNKLPQTAINSYYRCCRVSAESSKAWHHSLDTRTMASRHRVITVASAAPIKTTKWAITEFQTTFTR